MDAPHLMLEVGQIIAGRYRIVKLLGRGGMGAVYKTEALHLEKAWAVKVLIPGLADDQDRRRFAEQFQSEARLLASLDHEGLPRIVDFFEEDGKHFLVMDYIEGEDLYKATNRGETKIDADTAMNWLRDLLDIVGYLHAHAPPIIVRDIKPSNVMLTSRGSIKLIDFGIAKTLEGDGRTATAIRGSGSLGFAPVEQYGGSSTDRRSDIYSIGATMYFVLTGKVPAGALQRMIAEEELVSVQQLNAAVPQRLSEVLDKMLAVAASKRYQTVDEVKQALGFAVPPAARGAEPAKPAQNGREQASGQVRAAKMQARVLAPDMVLKGRFVLRQQLGGDATVFLAEDHERPGLLFAIKSMEMPPPEQMAEAEVEQAAVQLCSLSSPSLPRYDSCWEESDECYVVIDYVEGPSLLEILQEHERAETRPTIGEAVTWGVEILAGLQYLHQQQLVHGNLRPANVVRDKNGHMVLLGFSLPQAIDPLGQRGLRVRHNAACFSPPETYFDTSVRVDQSVDIYAAGALLYYLLAAVPPTDAPRREVELERGRPDPLPPLRQYNDKIPQAVEDTVMQMLSLQPRQRVRSASDASRALLTAASSELRLAAEEAASSAKNSADRLPSSSIPVRTAAVDANIPRLKLKKIKVPKVADPLASPPPVKSGFDVSAPIPMFRTMAERARSAPQQVAPPPMVKPMSADEPKQEKRDLMATGSEVAQFLALYFATTVIGWSLGLLASLLAAGPDGINSLWIWAGLAGGVMGTAQWVALAKYDFEIINWVVPTAVGMTSYGWLASDPLAQSGLPALVIFLVPLGAGAFLGLVQYLMALRFRVEPAAGWILATAIALLALSHFSDYHSFMQITLTALSKRTVDATAALKVYLSCIKAALPIGVLLGIPQAACLAYMGREFETIA